MQDEDADDLESHCPRAVRGRDATPNDEGRRGSFLQGRGNKEHPPLRAHRRMQSPDHDGSRHTKDRDAPGQSCVYIPPGDHFHETYRLSTFSRYPNNVPINPIDLARAGFYFTGFRDRAKCCSCGMAVENWIVGDDVFDPQWHASNCLFAQDREDRNVLSISTKFRLIRQRGLGHSPSQHNRSRGHGSGSLRQTNNSTLTNAPGRSSNFATDVADVMTNLRQVQINGNLPNLQLGNVVDPEHGELLRRLNLKSESDRRKTFVKWPSYPVPRLPSSLAKDGFFYLGNLDRVQCFSCSGVLRNWAPIDDVRDQHQRHFQQCRFIAGTDPRNVEMSDTQRQEADESDRIRFSALLPSENTREPRDPSAAEQRHLAMYLPCENPINPHMVSLRTRINTFTRWPTNHTRATVEEIANAGFFYLDESDKTKCFYCNGGLQNWDFHDEPWTEHGKWFPGCEFVLRQKGVEFVRRLADAHPNINRPSIRNPISFRLIPEFEEESQQGIQESNINSGHEDVVPTAAGEAIGGSVSQAPDILVNKKRHGEEGPEASPKRRKSQDENGESLLNSLREIEEAMLCRMCKRNKAEAIVMPCAHLCSCHDCVPNMKKCPICEHRVREFMKVYRA